MRDYQEPAEDGDRILDKAAGRSLPTVWESQPRNEAPPSVPATALTKPVNRPLTN
ncbi:hypothetical protein [Edaphobacter sp. 12200R-103]|uniref:hypothetical protein n=1 Tax=Edaphobacter sp. 12200R-103 TaxID=2703788 RepID=UPI00138D27FC|nr:hypothetical protein [Edaphobacter sp. 12200R-103]QHS50810.1 hypothetical protein GWR55_02895 [Edaphobacter sp. 12200R-103]